MSGDRLEEFEEIIGYHFERALGYRRELGSSATPQILVNLGLSAAEHLWKGCDWFLRDREQICRPQLGF